MATKDWKRISGGWQNKKNKDKIEIITVDAGRFSREYYYRVIVIENGEKRAYDNALTSKKDALISVKSYMRTH